MALPHAELVSGHDLRRSRRSLVVADIVESVRIMQVHENDFIARWMQLVDEIRNEVLPTFGGRLVKSYGDGLLLEFWSVNAAVAAALDLQSRVDPYNEGRPSSAVMQLRIGVHVADVIVDELDLYGAGVNLAARLASLAGAGQIVVSMQARDELIDHIDGSIVDLGECFLKHYAEPVRAYRVCAPKPHIASSPSEFGERMSLAVVPFAAETADESHSALGDALADDIIAALSRSATLTMISRLSTTALRAVDSMAAASRAVLGAAYLLCGSYRVDGDRLVVQTELRDTRDDRILWADCQVGGIADLFHGQDRIVPTIAACVGREVLQAEFERARVLPMPTLQDYTLYMGGVMMLHRLARADFNRSRDLLEHLAQRHPRSAAPLAMLAKWNVLNMVQGWATDVSISGRQARDCARRALDLEPDHALALSMDAAAMAHLGEDLDAARTRCEAAAEADPQEPHAWLTLGALHSYVGDADRAESLAARAIALSPVDPARFLFDMFLAVGRLGAGKYDEAADAAHASIRLNAMHPASYRLLTIALALGGKLAEARISAAEMMRIDPNFRVGIYAQRYAGRDRPHAKLRVQALLMAGVPA